MENKKKKSIPENATLVFKGEIFEIWQWKQKMWDDSVEIFERAVRPDVVEVLGTVGDKIFLTEQEQPVLGSFFTLPGGTADHGGTPLEEAQREFLEETGYVSDDWELWNVFSYPSGKVLFDYYYFIARNCRKEKEINPDPGEKIKPTLVSFDDLLMMGDNQNFRGHGIGKFFLEMRLDEGKRAAFKKLLFPQRSD